MTGSTRSTLATLGMNKQLVLRRIAAIVGVALLASACSERVVDMDGTRPVVDAEATKGAAEDVVVVLNEQVNELQSDGTRLFWYGQQPDVPCTENHAFAVRSCIIGDCANTLVTYANWLVSCSTPADIQDTAGRTVVPSGTVAGTFGRITTDGLNIYWGTELYSCPILGCDPKSRVAFSGSMKTERVMAERLYWLNSSSPFGLQRCVPERCTETVETIAVFDIDVLGTSVQGLVVGTTHAYWVANSSIRRVALDGRSPIETIASSQAQPTGLTMTEGDIYWANGFFPGTISRCTTAACGDANPTVIVAGQNYPSWTGVTGSSLFWTNGNGFGSETELLSCSLTDCSAALQSLESSPGLILGHWIDNGTLYYGTSADSGATTTIHRMKPR